MGDAAPFVSVSACVTRLASRTAHTYLTLVYQTTGLKRPDNLIDNQATRLADLLRYNLKECSRPPLPRGVPAILGVREPDVGREVPRLVVHGGLRRHRPLILNWFHALGMISAGVVEGFNGKAKRTTIKAYGFRTLQGIEFALFHVMGNLPEPECTHRFC